jgi:hypothetical protein
MTRRREPETAREKIADVARWADQQGLHNIAAQLRSALSLLPEDPPAPQRGKATRR